MPEAGDRVWPTRLEDLCVSGLRRYVADLLVEVERFFFFGSGT